MHSDRGLKAWNALPHPIRWVVVAGVGSTLVVIGLALLVLPGPGIPILILGLIVLATEFAWAELVLRKVKQHSTDAVGKARALARRKSRSADD
ncbi:MAG: PGPGW domain-containing protein [Actinomycetes bacterium]